MFSVNSNSTVIFSAINDYEFQSCEDFLVTQCEFSFLFSLVLIFLLEFYDKIFQFFFCEIITKITIRFHRFHQNCLYCTFIRILCALGFAGNFCHYPHIST